MSRENVEIVQRFYASGPSDLLKAEAQVDQAFRDFLDEDFEVRWPPTWPEGEQVFRGREGLAELFATLRGSWAEWRVQPERFLDAGDRVVVYVRMRARGPQAAPRSSSSGRKSGAFEAIARHLCGSTSIAPKPSKPWACGIRRCGGGRGGREERA